MLLAITLRHFAAHYAAMLQSWSHLLWIWDVVLFLLGLIFLFSARRGYRAMVMANCAALGWYLGMFLAHWSWIAGAAAALIGTVLGVVLVPLMRVALFIAGALTGGVVGIALWHVFKQPPDYRWVPAILGVIVLGIAALYLFEASAVVICTLEGAVLTVIGVTGWILHYGPPRWRHLVLANIGKQPLNLCAVVIGITCIGLLAQKICFGGAGKKEKAN